MAGKKDDEKKGGGNPLARKLLASIGEKAKKPEEGAKAPAGGKAPEPAKAAAKGPGGPLGELVSTLKQAAPNFGKEEPQPARKPEGWEHLKAARGARGIGPGAKAAQSKAVQAALLAAGYKVAETGVYDEGTEEAVRRFQKDQALDRRSGVFDEATFAAMERKLGLSAAGRINVTISGPLEGSDEDREAAAGPRVEPGGAFGAPAPQADEGGMVPGMTPRGARIGMGVDLTLPVGGGKKPAAPAGEGKRRRAPEDEEEAAAGPPRAPISSYTEPSDEDLEEERARERAASKAAGDRRPPGFPLADNAFIDRIAWPAVRAMWETGVPASALIAMAVLESGWGERALAKEARNLYGLRGEGPAGSLTLTMGEAGYPRTTEEAGEVAGGGRGKGKRLAWRRYASEAESVLDMARTLASEPAYADAVVNRGAADRLLRALDDTGEHDRVDHFGETCVRVRKQHGLEVYDRLRPG
jgi:flagellum-specific peptidoglycan hydrolase FlgJ